MNFGDVVRCGIRSKTEIGVEARWIGEAKGGSAVFLMAKGLMVMEYSDRVAKTPIVFREVRLEKGALEVEGRAGLKGWSRCVWWEW